MLETPLTVQDVEGLLKDKDLSIEDRTMLLIAYSLLFNSDIETNIKGAYALYINNLKFNDTTKSRMTKDIDVSFKVSSDKLENAFLAWANKTGVKIEKIHKTQNNNLSIKLLVNPIDENLNIIQNEEFIKIRIDCMASEDANRSVMSLNDIIKTKLNLKLAIKDRRLKDLIDVMNTLELYYSDGISKKDLLDMIEDKTLIEKFTEEDINSCYSQTESFHNPNISKEKAKYYVSSFSSMILGLSDRGIPESYVFSNGYWNMGSSKS